VIALLQRVTEASVTIGGRPRGAIGPGLVALIGVRPSDGAREGERLLDRILRYRIFGDEQGRMNRSVADLRGGLLLVPQFTLAANTTKGLRPGFSHAAPPEQARALFEALVARAHERHAPVESGVFGADMQVSLTNDGPVTIWLES